MEKYLGVKLIEATPMTRGAFAKHKYHKEVNEGLPEDEGYLVIYEGGYETWSPKEVFEKAYKKEITLKTDFKEEKLEDFQKRVYNEWIELDAKCDLLKTFILVNPIFTKLPKEDQDLLKQQLKAMEYYSIILVERLNKF